MARCKKTCIGERNRRISILRRNLIASNSDSAEPVLSYETVFSVRAKIKTNGGTNEWSRVKVGDLDASHTINIAHTRVAFDARDRVRDGSGNLYAILKIENVNEQDDELNIYCARVGDENKAIAA